MSKPQAEPTILDETCSICGRVVFGAVTLLGGLGHWRHDACELGSESWKEHYLSLSPEKQAPLTEYYLLVYTAKEGEPNAVPQES